MQGRVLIVGGSQAYTGAPYLAAIAALRAGAESVVVMAPEKVAWALNALSPDLMTRKLRGEHLALAHARIIKKLLATADVLVIGNGIGMRKETGALVRVLVRWEGKKVIDADALKLLGKTPVRNAILTPNDGEWQIMQHNSDMRDLQAHNVIVKKGATTLIRSSARSYSIKAHPGLSKAGSGDVFAGMCAGFFSRGASAFVAAQKAARLGNKVAFKVARDMRPLSFLASDLVSEDHK